VNFTPANFVFGRGKINKKEVVVGGDDFTVRGGAADASIHQKQVMAEQLANEYRLPIIRLIEGTGGGGSVKSLDTDARTYIPANPGWNWVVENLSTVPVIALALGPVAGLGAARMVTCHFSIMVEEFSQTLHYRWTSNEHLG
jgi:acetyl-CoA carboxylase carboxyltransferase component